MVEKPLDMAIDMNHAPPVYLPKTLQFTEEQFAEIIKANPNLRFALTASGELIAMPPSRLTSVFGIAKLNWLRSLTPQRDFAYPMAPFAHPMLHGLLRNVGSASPQRNAKALCLFAPILSLNSPLPVMTCPI